MLSNLQDVRYLMEDIQELKPTIFCGVPRVYERIYGGMDFISCSSYSLSIVDLCFSKHSWKFVYEGAIAKISSGGALRKALFQYAYN